ncbi:ATP-grasp domain-containing protein OS=Streptomyces albaduncus OX=68172 GN=FHS32_002719 PE=4 SV=1 [Streptomyces griseoloalbus]
MELEDLNPYLSLDALDDATRDAFVAATTASLHRFLRAAGAVRG